MKLVDRLSALLRGGSGRSGDLDPGADPVMRVRSLAYRTDLLIARADGLVRDHGDYFSVRTALERGSVLQNFVLFRAPPRAGDLSRWLRISTREIGPQASRGHCTIAWDGVDGTLGTIGPFLDHGFKLTRWTVLSTRSVVRPPKFCENVEVRPLTEDWEWDAILQAEMEDKDPDLETEWFEEYIRGQIAQRRRLVDAGLGRWFGAFRGRRIVGNLGLFVFDGLGRFQSVTTRQQDRRQGVCGALLYASARYGLEDLGAERLVIVGEADHHAPNIYESVGFEPVERQQILIRLARPPRESGFRAPARLRSRTPRSDS